MIPGLIVSGWSESCLVTSVMHYNVTTTRTTTCCLAKQGMGKRIYAGLHTFPNTTSHYHPCLHSFRSTRERSSSFPTLKRSLRIYFVSILLLKSYSPGCCGGRLRRALAGNPASFLWGLEPVPSQEFKSASWVRK